MESTAIYAAPWHSKWPIQCSANFQWDAGIPGTWEVLKLRVSNAKALRGARSSVPGYDQSPVLRVEAWV